MSEQTHSSNDKPPGRLARWLSSIIQTSTGNVLKAIGVLFALGSMLFTIVYSIDRRVESRINDPVFIQKLAANLRPSAIFDASDSILADMGAMQYIEQIDVEPADDGAFTIAVSPTDFLGVQPILESIDGNFVISAKRGPRFDWIFELRGVQAIVTEGSAIPETYRFRIELIR